MNPYGPDHLTLGSIDWPAHVTLIGQANAALARYDGMLQSIVNPAVLLSPLTIQEAVLSSRIEGTQASMEEVLEFEADSREPMDPARRADIHRADFVQHSGIPRDSARRILDVLRKEGIIQELRPARGRRGAVMAFAELLRITRE